MEFLVKALIILSAALILSACEDDVPFGQDPQTLDLTLENVEPVALGLVQSTFLTHKDARLYEYLDASDAPEGSLVNNLDTGLLELENEACPGGGTYSLSFTRAPGVAHLVGDRVGVLYTDCVINTPATATRDAYDTTYNGTFTARYTKLGGLNNRFVEIDTETCVSRADEVLNPNKDQISLVGTSLAFIRESNTYRLYVDDKATNEVIYENDRVVILLENPDAPTNAAPSLGGDEVYTVRGLEWMRERCQAYERTFSVTLRNFSTERDDYATGDTLKTTLNGGVSLFNGSYDLNTQTYEIRDSDFSVSVQQGNSQKTYSLNDFTMSKTVDLSTKVAAHSMSGDLHLNEFGSFGLVTTNEALLSAEDTPYFYGGATLIQAKEFEVMFIFPSPINDTSVTISFSTEGDTSGNNQANLDDESPIETTWVDLFNREFIYSE